MVIGEDSPRIPTIGAVAMPGAASAAIARPVRSCGHCRFGGKRLLVRQHERRARVLAAMGVPADIAGSFLRISFGPTTSEADIDRFLAEWRRIAERAQAKAA